MTSRPPITPTGTPTGAPSRATASKPAPSLASTGAATDMPQSLCGKSLLCYSILALPLAFIGLPLYIHAPDFYATDGGLSLAVIGFLVFIVRLLDALQDPLFGMLSDRYPRARTPLMALAILVLAGAFFCLFAPPIPSAECTEQTLIATVWFFVTLLLATSAFSFLQINHNALGSLWSKNTFHKTKITAAREAMTMIGLLAGAALPAVLMLFMDKQQAFIAYGWIFAGLAGVAGTIFLVWTRRTPSMARACGLGDHEANYTEDGANTQAAAGAADFSGQTADNTESSKPKKLQNQRFQSLHEVIRPLNTHYRTFFVLYLISMLASALPAVLVVFFIRDVVGAEQYMGFFLAIYFLSGAMMLPFWTYLAKMVGKEKAWFCAMILAIISFIWAFFIGEGDIMSYAFICFFSGAALGAELALPPSILSDYIDRAGEDRHSAKNFALMTFLSKLSIALASVLAFAVLHFSGFMPAQDNAATALFSLGLVYAVVPCVFKAAAAGLLWRWIHAPTNTTLKGLHSDEKSLHTPNVHGGASDVERMQ